MRIAGLATGMDVDTMVKDTIKPYRMKVDKFQQDNDIYEMKQQLYRDVLKDSREFYNKYFDIAKTDSLLSVSNWEAVKFSSSNESAVTIKGIAGATAENYTIDIKELAMAASTTLLDTEIASANTIEVSVNVGGVDKTISVNTDKGGALGKKSSAELIEELNANLKSNGSGITAKYSEFSKGISLETKTLGDSSKFTVELDGVPKEAIGKNANILITNSKDVKYPYTGNSNFLRLDGVEFTFTAKTDVANSVKVTGKNDVKALKDKIVGFVNDYNKLLEGINTKLYEKRDKKYMPLTPEQRKEMSEDEVKLWEGKVKQGQLRKDNDLEKLVGSMKNALSPVMDKLGDIGIKPVYNYAEKNGMLIIDESKLVAALENDATAVKDLFIKPPSGDKTKDGGIMHSLKDVFYEQTYTITASLIKKVGLEGSVTAVNNEYTLIMDKKKIQIAEMERQLVQRENNLYLKYSRLESQMANLNNQSAYLTKQLGA